MFVSRSKIQKTIELMGDPPQYIQDEVKRRYKKGDYFIRRPLKPRLTTASTVGIEEKIKRMMVREDIIKILPKIDCGLCGSPTCDSFAYDVANGKAKRENCILLSNEQLDSLRQRYGIDLSPPKED